jgi:GNAT superfamily N-acetyltransferase
MTLEAGPDELFTTVARAADVPALVALVNAAYRGTPSRRGWTSEEHLLAGTRVAAADISELLAAPDGAMLLIRGQSALNGCVHLKKTDADTVYLSLLSVRPAMQSSQLGRSLLAAAERYAREQFAAKRIEMTVIEQREELLAWYERRGYTRTGELRPFPYDDARLGTPTRDDLRFVVLERRLDR